jgi:pentatricopeptide repeat protein
MDAMASFDIAALRAACLSHIDAFHAISVTDEILLVASVLGCALLWVAASHRKKKGMKKPRYWEKVMCHFTPKIEEHMAAGHPEKVLSSWRAVQAQQATSIDALKIVVQAFIEAEPDSLKGDLCEHMQSHRELRNSKVAAAVLEVPARAGLISAMEEMFSMITGELGITPCTFVYEALLGGYASAGLEAKVEERLSEIRSRHKVSARGYSLMIKGFLKKCMVEAASRQIQAMHKDGHFVPSFAVTQLCRVACNEGSWATVLAEAKDSLTLSSDAVNILLADCQKRDDIVTAFDVEKLARDAKVALRIHGYDALLMLCCQHADLRALELFQEMQDKQIPISQGFCLSMLGRCAPSRFARFADVIADYLRSRSAMRLAVYSALMRVYASCEMYDKACDLYVELQRYGLEPDHMMYGCLMKFAVECGRTELSRELSKKVPSMDIQNYMSLIRAAGRERDVDRAFQIMEKMKSAGVAVDLSAYTCVLDVCVSAGKMPRAKDLLADMQKLGALDTVAYNTMLKGYCSAGDISGAKSMLLEMRAAGVMPNEISYNSLINAAAKSGNFKEAWATVETMEAAGFPVDNYTLSIMLKALKKSPVAGDAQKVFALVDRSGLDASADEVLLNSLLETCIRNREWKRLENMVSSFLESNKRPSVRTYGVLIKSCCTLRQFDKCSDLWKEMTVDRAMLPNDYAFVSMLESLISNDRVDDAVALFNQWKSTIPLNATICCTLIKGFSSKQQSSRAMEFFEEIRNTNVQLDTFFFNAMIDSQARTGAMDKVDELVKYMEASGCKPDAITSATILKSHVVGNNLDKAYEIFCNMQRKRMPIDSVYNTLLEACTRQHRADLADALLLDMEKIGIKPTNYTLGILVKLFERRKQLDKAFNVVEDLSRKHNLKPNPHVRNCLLGASIRSDNFAKANQVYEDLKNCGQNADVKSYTLLIDANLRRGEAFEAVRLVEEAYGIGQHRCLPPDKMLESETLGQLLRALSSRGYMPTVGDKLLEDLRAAKVPATSHLISTIMN